MVENRWSKGTFANPYNFSGVARVSVCYPKKYLNFEHVLKIIMDSYYLSLNEYQSFLYLQVVTCSIN